LLVIFYPVGDKKAVRIYNYFVKNSYLKIYSLQEDYKFLEPKLVNSSKVIRLAGKDFEILSWKLRTGQIAVNGSKFTDKGILDFRREKIAKRAILCKKNKYFALYFCTRSARKKI